MQSIRTYADNYAYANTHTRVCPKAYAYFAYMLGHLFLSGTVPLFP